MADKNIIIKEENQDLETTQTDEEKSSIIWLAQYIDDIENSKRYISGIRQVSSKTYYNRRLWIVLTQEVYNFLYDRLEFTDGTKSPYWIRIGQESIDNIKDISVDEAIDILETKLTQYVNYYKKSMEEILVSRTRLYPYKLWKYFNTYNVLLSKGYVITDENQEEKFIEIINKGDESLLNTLSEYLDIKDTMNLDSVVFSDFTNYSERLGLATSKEEAELIYEEFMSNYR